METEREGERKEWDRKLKEERKEREKWEGRCREEKRGREEWEKRGRDEEEKVEGLRKEVFFFFFLNFPFYPLPYLISLNPPFSPLQIARLSKLLPPPPPTTPEPQPQQTQQQSLVDKQLVSAMFVQYVRFQISLFYSPPITAFPHIDKLYSQISCSKKRGFEGSLSSSRPIQRRQKIGWS